MFELSDTCENITHILKTCKTFSVNTKGYLLTPMTVSFCPENDNFVSFLDRTTTNSPVLG